jgi:hypothetical protein
VGGGPVQRYARGVGVALGQLEEEEGHRPGLAGPRGPHRPDGRLGGLSQRPGKIPF